MKEIFKRVIGLLFPKVCPGCGNIIHEKELVCESCRKEVEILKKDCCARCGKKLLTNTSLYCQTCKKRSRRFDEGVSVFRYQGILKKSIHQFKYDNLRQFSDYYGTVAWEQNREKLNVWNPECIVPVPMFRGKEIRRGYNQATVFAKSLSKKSGIPVKENLLIRRKNTKPQKGLTDEQRMENLKGAFSVDWKSVKGMTSVLLVDDIYTTGSTMDVCAGLLKKAGVKRVYFLCIATGKDYEA